MQSSKRQAGSTLIIVVLLLALAGILTLFGLNTGMFEQRTSGNDLKAKTVGEMAEAGMAQGAEFIHQHPAYLTDATKWTLCDATDTSFPCGSVPAARRGTMYHWSAGGYDFDGGGTATWENSMLPIPAALKVATAGNGFAVQYGVGAVLCRVAYKAVTTDPTVCTDSASASPTSIVTMVALAAIPGESARNTVTQSVGSYSLVGNLPAAPPILASGSVDISGGMQVVTNPNSAGTGVPVSVWTRKQLTKTGTANTCYYNEFLHNSAGGANGTIYTDTGSPNYPLCDNCTCAGADSLSYTASGNKADFGVDVLQNSGLNSDYSQALAAGYANYDVKPTEFPCDLFQQIFGVQAWDDSDGDNFCDRKLMTTYKNPNTSIDVTMGVDEAYLFQNATTIIPSASTTAASLATTAQTTLPAAYPSSSYAGLIWCQVNCDIGSGVTLGSAANPVLLVVDGSITIKGKVFGMVFLRTLAKVSGSTVTVTPSGGYTMPSSEASSGGNADLTMNGGGSNSAVVYGAVVVQGTATHLNGSNSIVYNSDVLTNLANSASLIKFGGVPGAWTDRISY